VQIPYKKWLVFLYGPIFSVIGFIYRVYAANRLRLQQFKANEKVSSFIKLMTLLILLGWFLTWYFASEQGRPSLVDEVRQSIGGLNSPAGE